MKLQPLSILFILFCPGLYAQNPVFAPNQQTWIPVFTDEFNESTLDKNIWKIENGSYNNSGNSRRDSSNNKLENGDLRIYLKKTTDVNKPLLKWTCGYIYTKKTFGRNVYFEARMKTPKISGVNNAFWLVTRTELPTSYSNRYEVDINEIQFDINKKKHACRLGWHDWKTYQYATNANGQAVDNGLGAMIYYDSEDYQVWGFWLKDNEFHYYLNGQEIWNGITHSTYTNLWNTGVGIISPWATQEEQRAYGKIKQQDWSYLGGYTGELMHIAFSNMMMALNWTPETDLADNSYMSVDWIRVFEPTDVLNKIPASHFTENESKEITGNIQCVNDTIILKQGKIRIPLDKPFSFAETQQKYFSFWFNNTKNTIFKISLLNNVGEVIGELSSDEYKDWSLNFGENKTSSSSVFPYAFYNQPKKELNEGLVINRLTANTGLGVFDGDAWSVKLINKDEQIPDIEPYYYPNIDETGQTSFNNQWSLNAKKIISSTATAIQIENVTPNELRISNLRFGNNYLAMISDELAHPYASTGEMLIHSVGVIDTVKIDIRSLDTIHQVAILENDEPKMMNNLFPGINKIPVSPTKTTVYKLASIKSDKSVGYVSGSKTTIFVATQEDRTIYPTFDTYIQENSPEADFSSASDLIVKTDRGYVRESFMEFNISPLSYNTKNAGAFFYLKSILPVESVLVGVFAVEDSIVQPFCWKKRPSWTKLKKIGQFELNTTNPRYYGVDICNYLNECISRGKKKISLQLSVINGNSFTLVKFAQYATGNLAQSPKIIYNLDSNFSFDKSITVTPTFDTFTAQQSTGSIVGSGNIENYCWIKNSKSVCWGSDGYFSFDFNIDPKQNISSALFKLHLYNITGAKQYVFAATSGITSNPDISNLTWTDAQLITDVKEIGIAAIDTIDAGKYITWDVSEFLKSECAAGKTKITIKVSAVGGSVDALLKFDQGHKNTTASQFPPQLQIVTTPKVNTGITLVHNESFIVYPNPVSDYITVCGTDIRKIDIYALDGVLQMSVFNSYRAINLSRLTTGVYFILGTSITNKHYTTKIIKIK